MNKSPLDGMTPEQQGKELAYARSVLRKASEYAFEGLDEKSEQLCSLASIVTEQLTPPDPQNPPDDWPINAWRLAQILEDLLINRQDLTAARAFLLGAAA